MAPLNTVRTFLLWLGVSLQSHLRQVLAPRLAVMRAQPQRGASAIEWVIITAVVVVIVTAVGLIIQQLVMDTANDIQVEIPQ